MGVANVSSSFGGSSSTRRLALPAGVGHGHRVDHKSEPILACAAISFANRLACSPKPPYDSMINGTKSACSAAARSAYCRALVPSALAAVERVRLEAVSLYDTAVGWTTETST